MRAEEVVADALLLETVGDEEIGWKVAVRLARIAVKAIRSLPVGQRMEAMGMERFGTYLHPEHYGPSYDHFTETKCDYLEGVTTPLWREK